MITAPMQPSLVAEAAEAPPPHPALPAVAAVASLAASGELRASVGARRAGALQQRAGRVQHCLAYPPVSCAPLYDLARECLSLASTVEGDFNDGTQEIAGVALGAAADAEDCGWEFGVAVAEAAAHGLAAFAAGLQLEPQDTAMHFLERLSLDLDYFAAHIFGGLSRLGACELALADCDARLLRALQAVCTWSTVAVGRTIGYANLTAVILWEWACRDSVWALVLAKGVLSAPTAEEICSPGVAVPAECRELQQAVLAAVEGLPSPDVAFSGDQHLGDGGGEEVTIGTLNTGLVRHRAELAALAAGLRVLPALVAVAARGGAPAAPGLAGFLAAVLQPELADEAWELTSSVAASAAAEVLVGEPSPDATAAVALARTAANSLANQLARLAGTLWGLFAAAVAAFAAAGAGAKRRLPPGFLQDCCGIAYFVPPAGDALTSILASCLDESTGASVEPATLAALCFLSANAGATPGGELGGPLVAVLLRLCPENPERAEVQMRWNRWRGPVRLLEFAQWTMLFDAQQATGPPSPEAAQQPGRAPEAVCATAAPAPPAAPPAVPPPARGRGTVLQELVAEAPAEFRCAFDGQLMMDPVRSPQGHVFERAGLMYVLGALGGFCPVTGSPLSLEECVRVPELRRRIGQWLRARRSVERNGERRSRTRGPRFLWVEAPP